MSRYKKLLKDCVIENWNTEEKHCIISLYLFKPEWTKKREAQLKDLINVHKHKLKHMVMVGVYKGRECTIIEFVPQMHVEWFTCYLNGAKDVYLMKQVKDFIKPINANFLKRGVRV